MIPGKLLLDTFINANILFCVAFALWYVVRLALGQTALRHAHGAQLRLLNMIFLVVIAAPLIALGFTTLQSAGVAKGVSLNLSDMVVAYYLNGGFHMNAAEFEGLVHARETFMQNVLTGAGFFAQAAIAAFLVGLALGLMRLGYSIFCLFRIVARSYAWRGFGRIRIRLSDRTLVPFSTRGLWNYYVVIPSHMLESGPELKVSLAHEFQHIRQGDMEWEILLEALKPLFFLNPAFHAWKRRVEDLRELNCDRAVLSRGRIGVRTYCDTLLSVCQKTLRRDRTFVIAVPKVTLVTADRSALRDGKMSFLERRILSVLDAKRARSERLVFGAVTVLMIGTMTLTTLAIQRPGDWSHDRLMLSTVVNLERLDEINRLSTFGRIRN